MCTWHGSLCAPGYELAVAQREGGLYRNFQGYSTHADCDLVAMGITAIGKVGDSYSQNVKPWTVFGRLMPDTCRFSVALFERDDKLRRAIITQLICHFELNYARIEQAFNVRFRDYFAYELKEFEAMQADGLLDVGAHSLVIRPVGKLLIRNICMVFDTYLRAAHKQQFSKVI